MPIAPQQLDEGSLKNLLAEGQKGETVTPSAVDSEAKNSIRNVRETMSSMVSLAPLCLDQLAETDEGQKALSSWDDQEFREQLLNQVIGVVIVLNAFVMGIELDCGPADGAPFAQRAPWFFIEAIFILIFVVEIMLRMLWERLAWMRSLWNWLDFGLISFALVDTFVLTFALSGDSNLQMITLLRIVRLVRLVRVIRLVRMFRGLYVSVMAFKSAVSSIMYIGAIKVCGLYLCAIFSTATIGHNDDFQSIRMGNVFARDRFGTVLRSMYSLFELMTLEGWEDVGRPMVAVEPALALFLFGFIMIFTFGILNMIVAMVVEKTLLEARKVDELSKAETQRRVAQTLRWLKTVFEETDEDGSGVISWTEFEKAVNGNEKVQKGLEELGIPRNDVRALFMILDADDDEDLSLDEFLQGCAKLRGAYNPKLDLIAMHAHVLSISRQLKGLWDFAHDCWPERAANVGGDNVDASGAGSGSGHDKCGCKCAEVVQRLEAEQQELRRRLETESASRAAEHQELMHFLSSKLQ